MTNREWVQSMESDRLAEFISGFEYCNYCQACDYKRVECKKAIKAWLEAEHVETQLVKEYKNLKFEELAEMDKIKITVNGNETIAKMGGKKGVAVCSPEDEFNIFTGAKIALDRLEEAWKSYSWIKLYKPYYVPAPARAALFDCFRYANDAVDKRYINRGLVFRTKEEAIEAAKKMLAALKENDNDRE